MFGRGKGENRLAGADRIAFLKGLHAFDIGCAKRSHKLCLLAETFIGSSPADILYHCDNRWKVPGDPRCQDLLRRGTADLFHEIRIVCGAQPDIMREDRRIQ